MTDEEIKKQVADSIKKAYIVGGIAGCIGGLKLVRGPSMVAVCGAVLGAYAGALLLNKIVKKYRPSSPLLTLGYEKKLLEFIKAP